MLRAIREIQPRYVVGENVRGFTNWNRGMVFDQVQSDLEAEGYEVLPFLLPAVGVNAPHRRNRIWLVAKNTLRNGRESVEREEKSEARGQRDVGPGDNERICADYEKIIINPDADGLNRWQNFPTQPPVRCGNDGFPSGLVGITVSKHRNESIKAYGNAVVPELVFQIFKSIEKYEFDFN